MYIRNNKKKNPHVANFHQSRAGRKQTGLQEGLETTEEIVTGVTAYNCPAARFN
jgi:hypothetical protein